MDEKVADRIKGTILGSACANALGGSCIGLNHRDIMLSVGPMGIRDFSPGLSKSFLPDHKPGNYLADTYMALDLALSLVEADGRFQDADFKRRLGLRLADPGFLAAHPGAHCLSALRRMVDGVSPLDDGSPEAVHDHGATRAYILGCFPDRVGHIDVAKQQAALAQADSRVQAAAAVLADSIHRLVRGMPLASESDVRAYVREEFALAETIDERFAESWDDVAPDLDYIHPAHELPYSVLNVQADVQEAVPTAVGIFLIFRHNFEEAVCAASVCGGETDTVGAIVGALAGAYHGAGAIPERWLKGLVQREDLESCCQSIIDLW